MSSASSFLDCLIIWRGEREDNKGHLPFLCFTGEPRVRCVSVNGNHLLGLEALSSSERV